MYISACVIFCIQVQGKRLQASLLGVASGIKTAPKPLPRRNDQASLAYSQRLRKDREVGIAFSPEAHARSAEGRGECELFFLFFMAEWDHVLLSVTLVIFQASNSVQAIG